MSKKIAKNQRRKAIAARDRLDDSSRVAKVSSKDDDFEKELRDFVELMKAVVLGLGMASGAFAIMRSSMPDTVRAIGAWVCVSLGLAAAMASCLIYARHRLSIKDQTPGSVVVRGLGLIMLLVTVLGAFTITVEVHRQVPERHNASRYPAESCLPERTVTSEWGYNSGGYASSAGELEVTIERKAPVDERDRHCHIPKASMTSAASDHGSRGHPRAT